MAKMLVTGDAGFIRTDVPALLIGYGFEVAFLSSDWASLRGPECREKEQAV